MQFQICNSGDVWVSLTQAEAHRIAKKRTGALAGLIRGQRKAQARRADAQESRRAEQSLQMELRESDRRNRALWRRLRVSPVDKPTVPLERKLRPHRPTRSGWLAGGSQLPSYSGQLIDRAGRAGIFFRLQYYCASTKPGVGRRSTNYIWVGAFETADDRVMFESNVGETAEEAMAALELTELVNREAQANGKALFHMIANVPYQLERLADGPERMMDIGQRFANEAFGSRDLPYALALHPPSRDGDQRNWHLHIIFSTRPLIRTGEHEWAIGTMLRREIDNPEAFEALRHLYAAVQTEVAQEAGLNMAYTALSNVERGLPNAHQKHLGSARTARVRRGEEDPINESNWVKMLAGEAALIDERLRRQQEAGAAEIAVLDHVEARAKPMLLKAVQGPLLAIASSMRRKSTTIATTARAVASVLKDRRDVVALTISNLKSNIEHSVGATSSLVSRSVASVIGAVVPTPGVIAAARVVPRTASSSFIRETVRVVALPAHPSPVVDQFARQVGATSRLSDKFVECSGIRLPLPGINSIPHTIAASLGERMIATIEAAEQSNALPIGSMRNAAPATLEVPKTDHYLVITEPSSDLEVIFRLLDQQVAEAIEKQEESHGKAARSIDQEQSRPTLPIRDVEGVGEQRPIAGDTPRAMLALLRRVGAMNDAATGRWLAQHRLDGPTLSVKATKLAPERKPKGSIVLPARDRDGQGF